MYIPNTYKHTETIRSPVVDEPQPQSGGMKTSTEVGIGIGLLCFLSLILGFYIVSKWRGRPPPPRTHADEQIAMTYQRWEENMAGKTKSAPLEQLDNHYQAPEHYLPLHTPRPASTLSGVTVVDHQSPEHAQLPSLPSHAYFSHDQGQSLGTEHRGVL